MPKGEAPVVVPEETLEATARGKGEGTTSKGTTAKSRPQTNSTSKVVGRIVKGGRRKLVGGVRSSNSNNKLGAHLAT